VVVSSSVFSVVSQCCFKFRRRVKIIFNFVVGRGTGVAQCRGSVVRPRNVGAIAGVNQPFCLPHNDQGGCGARPASYSVGSCSKGEARDMVLSST
jgi:hypothetical protein